MVEEMKISISKEGMKVDANGFKGRSCLAELAELEKYLASVGVDLKIAEQVMKSESYNTSTQTNQNTRRY
jgi:hypothetical protein